ncbi:MAG TPA: hypothetical protein VHO47_01045 [Candidatus Babeliales bacterium]|nr:hypothetical protein [Candidatus Babeliales bacterium]
MNNRFLLVALLALSVLPHSGSAQENPDDDITMSADQQKIFNVLIGINQTCIGRISDVPQITLNRVMDAVKEATQQDLLLPLLHIYRLCVDSLVKDQQDVTISPDPIFLPNDLWATMIEEGFHRGLWTRDGIATAQVRDIFLACYIPCGLQHYAIVDLSQKNGQLSLIENN